MAHLTKEKYLLELVEKAATRIGEGFDATTRGIMTPVWRDIILKEVNPILVLIK